MCGGSTLPCAGAVRPLRPLGALWSVTPVTPVFPWADGRESRFRAARGHVQSGTARLCPCAGGFLSADRSSFLSEPETERREEYFGLAREAAAAHRTSASAYVARHNKPGPEPACATGPVATALCAWRNASTSVFIGWPDWATGGAPGAAKLALGASQDLLHHSG